MKFNLISNLIALSAIGVNGCEYVTFQEEYISQGNSTVILQDGGHRFYKKFSGTSIVYAIIDSTYPNGEECIAFNAAVLDPQSHIGIYNFTNKERTVKSDASIYYYPMVGKAKSFTTGEGTQNLDVISGNEPKVVDAQYSDLIFKINKNTGTIGLYYDSKKVTELQKEFFKTGFNFIFVGLRKQGEYITMINTASAEELKVQQQL